MACPISEAPQRMIVLSPNACNGLSAFKSKRGAAHIFAASGKLGTASCVRVIRGSANRFRVAITLVPTGVRSWSSITCSYNIRMQPFETSAPIVHERLAAANDLAGTADFGWV